MEKVTSRYRRMHREQNVKVHCSFLHCQWSLNILLTNLNNKPKTRKNSGRGRFKRCALEPSGYQQTRVSCSRPSSSLGMASSCQCSLGCELSHQCPPRVTTGSLVRNAGGPAPHWHGPFLESIIYRLRNTLNGNRPSWSFDPGPAQPLSGSYAMVLCRGLVPLLMTYPLVDSRHSSESGWKTV